MKKLSAGNAWLEIADRLASWKWGEGFLCCQVDDLFIEHVIGAATKEEMHARIDEDLAAMGKEGWDVAYGHEGSYDSDDEEYLRGVVENRESRLLAALMFAHEALS